MDQLWPRLQATRLKDTTHSWVRNFEGHDLSGGDVLANGPPEKDLMNRFFKLFEGAWRDLRYAGRMLRKHLLFSLAIVVTVALGIGANASIFGVINAVLLEPLPYKNPDRLVRLWESNPRQSQPESPVSVPNYQDWQRQQSAFEEVAALEMATYNITDWGEPQRVASARITTNLAPMLG